MSEASKSKTGTGAGLGLLNSRLREFMLLITAFTCLSGLATTEVLYMHPGEDVVSEWSEKGCPSGFHFRCLDESIRNPSQPDTSDYISEQSTSDSVDQHRITGILPSDIRWMALNTYSNTTGRADLSVELRNDSNAVKNNLVDQGGAGWSVLNWTGPVSPANISARFQPQNGTGEDFNVSVSSWYLKVKYRNDPPEWRSQMQNQSSITSKEPLKLSAQGFDRLNLSHAVLATNETGKWGNRTSLYGSPLEIYKSNSWEWSNFTWRNKTIKNRVVGWRIYYNDSDGATNLTEVRVFEVNSPRVKEISFNYNPVEAGIEVNITSDISSPSSYDLKSVNINLTDADSIREYRSEMKRYDKGKYFFNTTIENETSNIGQWSVKIAAENTYGAKGFNSSTLEVLSKKPPDWRNQVQLKSDINSGGTNSLEAEGYDNFLLENATLATNETGQWRNKTSNYSSPKNLGTSRIWSETTFQWSNSSIKKGLVAWKVWYSDSQGQYTSTEIKSFFIEGKDLTVSNLYLNSSDPVQGQKIKLVSNISNKGKGKVESEDVKITVENFNGSWITREVAKKTVTVNQGSWKILNFSWRVKPGPNRFDVKTDPDATLQEINESNNFRRLTRNISSYTVVYGGNSARVRLGGSNSRFASWNADHRNMTLFFNDQDQVFSHLDLEPLNGSNDLQEADEALNMTGHHDSLQKQFDSDSDGEIDNTACMRVVSELCGIPVINSTETRSFRTGLLYDSENSKPFNGSQEVVIVSEVNNSKKGKYGTYDYEVRIPFALDEQEPATNSVSITGEIY